MVFSKFYDKYQKILLKSQIYIIVQKIIFPANWTKSTESNIKHQVSQYTCRYMISQLVRVSGIININLVESDLTIIALVWLQSSF